jgi:RNA polymerase primary sigma factor
MKNVDLFEEIIDLGKQRGFVTYNDIDGLLSPELVEQEELVHLLDDLEIEIIDGQEPDGEPEEVSGEQEQHEKSEDLVQSYFHSMGDIGVLSKDEETDLARKIEEGNRIIRDLVRSFPLYKKFLKELTHRFAEEESSSEEDRVDAALKDTLAALDHAMTGSSVPPKGKSSGDDRYQKIEAEVGTGIDELRLRYERITKARQLVSEAKNELIIRNLRLVINIAKHYVGRGLSLLDLIQEGNIGMMKAIDKYDYKKGFKFSTYATWWIRQALTRALMDQTKTIRVPVHVMELYHKVNTVSKELAQQLGREPEKEEIAQTLGIQTRKVEDVYRAMQDPVMLETPIGDDESTLADVIGDDSASPYSEAERNKLTEEIIKVLHTLSPREEAVIRMRFGVGAERDHTLEEVGRHLSLTRERVRQIEEKAMRKLKHPSRLRALRVLTATQ